jgi:hypothetical protein
MALLDELYRPVKMLERNPALLKALTSDSPADHA